MKKTEIAMIILIASLSMIATFFIARAILGDNIKREKTVPVVTQVKDELVPPSKLIFNEKAINPTIEIFVDQDVSSGANPDTQAQETNAEDEARTEN